MNIDIFFTILFTSLIQSIFGTGILLFGTPVLLMLGNNFQTTLTILLPASILVNCFQLRNNFRNIDQHFYISGIFNTPLRCHTRLSSQLIFNLLIMILYMYGLSERKTSCAYWFQGSTSFRFS